MATIFNKETSEAFTSLKQDSPLLKCFQKDSILHYVGDVNGKRVLDLGCADGSYARLVKTNGARTVAGVDNSEYMIKLAREEEKKNPLGIDYILQDGRTMGKIGEFDLVLGNLLLPYATNPDELQTLVDTIYCNLASSGGKFVAFTPDTSKSKWPPEFEAAVGFSLTKLSDVPNGRWCQIEALPFNSSTFFTKIMFLDFEIYQQAFIKAGFRYFMSQPGILSEEALNSHPKGFWDPVMRETIYHVLIAEK